MSCSIFTKFYAVLSFCLFFSAICTAQPQSDLFDSNSLETVSGEVIRVDEISPKGRMGYGIHIVLQTGDGDVSVHLGPSGYLSKQGLNIRQHDQITVTGMQATLNDKSFLIATKVEAKDKTVVLRDKDGRPMWSRRRY